MLHLRRLVEFLMSLDKYCEDLLSQATKTSSASASKIPVTAEQQMSAADLVSTLGKKVQGINLLQIESYLRTSKIARKISGYSEKLAAGGKSNHRSEFSKLISNLS